MSATTPRSEREQPVPLLQQLFENIWFLLILGIGVPTLLYTTWGIIDLVILPQFTP